MYVSGVSAKRTRADLDDDPSDGRMKRKHDQEERGSMVGRRRLG